jgi:hypothetical protein
VWFGRALSSWASAVLFDTPRATPVSEIGKSFGVTLSSSATKQNVDYEDITTTNDASKFLPQPAKSKLNDGVQETKLSDRSNGLPAVMGRPALTPLSRNF